LVFSGLILCTQIGEYRLWVSFAILEFIQESCDRILRIVERLLGRLAIELASTKNRPTFGTRQRRRQVTGSNSDILGSRIGKHIAPLLTTALATSLDVHGTASCERGGKL
jgi:hypothetical protein